MGFFFVSTIFDEHIGCLWIIHPTDPGRGCLFMRNSLQVTMFLAIDATGASLPELQVILSRKCLLCITGRPHKKNTQRAEGQPLHDSQLNQLQRLSYLFENRSKGFEPPSMGFLIPARLRKPVKSLYKDSGGIGIANAPKSQRREETFGKAPRVHNVHN